MIDRIKTWWQNISETEDKKEIKLNNVFEEKESTKRKLRKKTSYIKKNLKVYITFLIQKLLNLKLSKKNMS